MRIPALTVTAVAALLTAAPVRAQTYDPAYPICIQTYSHHGSAIICRFTSLAQCAATASGRAAQCITNPYYGPARATAGPNARRQREAY
ncbi:DUF3551 domain-containing protein [Bradyrhizobium sp. AUGA SZCCT0177]|uniref:DUF3551 domain-containing protein n=1 Tax=Bradyrhizobium sp. AUGA SZCCT0177 TaxID=2807665 RepID=UPI001BA9767C|nr:DUF3551 domain-containing protein [Bradyrhizobium sp. AUGA SZCCT0177]MBR1285455.1 DUF3551 domain-containing protein [Bradyrhizobium sp. AUGA SZCCT0177]